MKARYVTFFSYIGTRFRSSEKLWLKEGKQYLDPDSVQGLMEIALLKLRPLNFPQIALSSRTDGGVHALNASAHFDLERRGPNIYDTAHLVYELNKFFYKNNYSVSVKTCLRVSDNFNARKQALSRTYLYRLAIIKKKELLSEKTSFVPLMPIEEWKRCYFVKLAEFDAEKFRRAATYFPGYHDFGTFKKFIKGTNRKHDRRSLYSVKVRPGQPLITSYSNAKSQGLFDYWEVEVHGRSFVYNQIRRIVGAMIGVATGKLNEEEIKVMLQVPSKYSWPSRLDTVPPHGLYLCDVEYDPKDLIYDPHCEPVNKDLSDCTESD